MGFSLQPVASVTDDSLGRGKHSLVWDAAWASLTGAWSGGVILVGLALHMGARPMTIGLLAAIPFMAQVAQMPTIYLVEKVRKRKLIGIPVLTVARVIIMLLGLLALAPENSPRLALLVLGQGLIALLGSIGACAINSWFHQLLPAGTLGSFFGRRLLVASSLACAATLAAGMLTDHPPFGQVGFAFAITFGLAGLAGLASSVCLGRAPELVMPPRQATVPLRELMGAPLRDRNFRRLLVMLGSWNIASNIAAPFMTVYLIQQVGYGLGTVTFFWVVSQMFNAAALRLWGKLSDRLSNKSILAVALPVYFVATLGFVLAGMVERPELRLLLFYCLHAVMGGASGGISLATGNLALKLAPQAKGTSYLAVVGLIAAVAGGVAPLLGGALAQWFSTRELSLLLRWMSSARTSEVTVMAFAHWEFLFALSACLGLYVMHALSRIDEGTEISEHVVIQELALEALRTVNHLSSVGGVLGGVFSFERMSNASRALGKVSRQGLRRSRAWPPRPPAPRKSRHLP